jgi:probable F420-dependent oxidoreductase
LTLATGICLVPERNPLLLAKEVATVDMYSGGRFIFGIGTGWLKEETEILGGDFDHRWTQTKEAVLAMKELWTKTESEFHGKYYDFPPVYSFPRPVQRPHPPVFLGGMARNVLKRVIAWGDGWIPNRVTPDQVKEGRATLDRLAEEAGRDPASIKIFVSGQPADPDLIKRYEDAGVEHVVVRVATAGEEEALAELERTAKAVLA